MKLVYVPDPILYKPVAPVTSFDQSLKKIVKHMTKVLLSCKDPVGVGLAANQVGLDMQIFLMRPQENSPVEVYINPHIGYTSDTQTTIDDDCALEGCLSIPHIWGPIKRYTEVGITYQDIAGRIHERKFSDFEAVIVQHEIDHLNGILFTQRSLEQAQKIYEERRGKLHEMKVTSM